jgi:spermidine/putrescine transport system substrate-binding protein
MKRVITLLLVITPFIFLLNSTESMAAYESTLNVYNWSSYLPEDIIWRFQLETGIHVNYSTYDSNETLYAKLKTNRQAGYDIAAPSTYLVDRLRKENMLEKLDKSKLTNFKNLDPKLLNQTYDPNNEYSVPYLWGTTGIVVNSRYFSTSKLKRWADLWDPQYRDQLMLLDDQRDVFGIALKILGYSINETNPEHIKQAYLKLKELMPNVKLFNEEAEQAIYIDEDALLGMGYNGEIYQAHLENKDVIFVYPKEGVTVWLDSLVIPKGAKNIENAHQFINFLLRPDIAIRISEQLGFASPNLTAVKKMPKTTQNNPTIYPRNEELKNSEFQTDVGNAALIYEKYWELLKVGG